MRNFPTVTPSSRTLSGGAPRSTAYKSVSGKETRILLGDTASEHNLSLEFKNVLEAGVEAIMNHWTDAAGEFHSFGLPAAIFDGWSRYSAAVPTGQKWRYDGQPEVIAVAPGIMTVSVNFVSVV